MFLLFPLLFTHFIVETNNNFGFRLFSHLVKEENIFISPPSVSLALMMTYQGAGGETKEAMAKTLGLEGKTLTEINQANLKLLKLLKKPDPKVKLDIANSLWARKGIKFKNDFLKSNKDFYGAKITTLNFDNLNAPDIINKWVSEKTFGKIKKIVESIERNTVLFLINALYFKGAWQKEFDKSKTFEGTFTLLDGKKKKVPLMTQSGEYNYLKGDNFQAVYLPYGQGRIGMYLFLPDTASSLKEFLLSLNSNNWKKWLNQFGKKEGDITLPRFKLEYEQSLNNALKSLGIEIAFDPDRADFSKMAFLPPGLNLFLSKVKHKTFVEVNEKGTEAAAVTKVEVAMTAVVEKFSMVVDRPFFFAICEKETGLILFMGAVFELL